MPMSRALGWWAQASTRELAGAPLIGGSAMLLALAWMTPAFAFVPPTSIDQTSPSMLHHLLSNANLVFHEAGHMILSPLGRFMAVLGGSLFEVLIPMVCAVALWRTGSVVGPPFAVWWTGEAITEVANYMADARAGRLMLLGGQTGYEAPEGHDWRNLLTWTGLLEWDVTLAWIVHVAGAATMLVGLFWLGRLCWQGALAFLAAQNS